MPARKPPNPDLSTRVLRLRLKDKHAPALRAKARDVNFVWNYTNELSFKVWERERRFLSGYDFAAYTKGAAKEGLNLHSQTIQAISEEYAIRRKQFKKVKLRWRVSGGARRSLGWIPFKASALRYRNGQLLLSGLDQPLSLWDSYGLSKYELGAGNLSEDARGRWYLNITVKVPKPAKTEGKSAVGIDLGLKDFAGLSTGEVVEAERFYRDLEPKLAVAQRARKKGRTRALHAKIANRRKDFLHQLSTRLVTEHGAIFVGNVNAAGLAKTRMAKSVLDAGWSMFRTMLKYKSDDAGAWFGEVDESYSTQTCSACGARSGPKGLQGLGMREWVCPECGVAHHRDVNSGKVILARGHARLAGGIPFL
jgi:IS605 OrfB family transposase